MSMQIIQQWRLAVLRVELDVSRREPAVVATFLSHPSARREEQWSRRDSLRDYGLGSGGASSRVPDAVVRGVADALAHEGEQLTALWLRIVPPSGFLGAVPWERGLAPLGRPVLRVPDRLPVGTKPQDSWTIAAAINADRDQRWGAEHVRTLVAALAHFPLPVLVHVFPDAGTFSLMSADVISAGNASVVVHDPRAARRAPRTVARSHLSATSYVSTYRTPAQVWADWIVTGMGGRAANALHLASTAHIDVDIPLLTMAEDPAVPSDLSSCGFASEDQVQILADAVGASTLAFASPPGNPSDVATRLLADQAGGRRPGPTLYCDLGDVDSAIGPAEHSLVETYALLARPDRSESRLPTDPRLFAYLQPADIQALLADPLGAHVHDLATDVGYDVEPPPVLADLTEGTFLATTPTADDTQWLASSARFVDSQVADLLASASSSSSELPSSAYDAGAAAAVRDLNALLAQYGGEEK